MEKGEKYLSGEIDLGVNGKKRILVFANKNKEKQTHPDFNLFVDDEPESNDSNLKGVGALWKQEKKEKTKTGDYDDDENLLM